MISRIFILLPLPVAGFQPVACAASSWQVKVINNAYTSWKVLIKFPELIKYKVTCVLLLSPQNCLGAENSNHNTTETCNDADS